MFYSYKLAFSMIKKEDWIKTGLFQSSVPIFPSYVCKVNKVIGIAKTLPKGRAFLAFQLNHDVRKSLLNVLFIEHQWNIQYSIRTKLSQCIRGLNKSI